jgi:hypothetical protein
MTRTRDDGHDSRAVAKIARPGRTAAKALRDVSIELRSGARDVSLAVAVELAEIANQVDALTAKIAGK